MAKRGLFLTSRRNRTLRQQTVAGDTRHQPALVTPTIVETDFAQLEDGSMVELIEDSEVPSRSLFAVFKNGNVRYLDRVRANKTTLVPPSRDSELVKNVRLPRGAEPYESVGSLLLQMYSIFNLCMELKPTHSFLLANFVLSTWLVDQLPVAPYIAIVRLPGTGKSTLMQILTLLCRRSILTGDITSAAFYHVCDRLTPTLLIDETNTAGQRSNLFHLLRVGFTPGITALRKNHSFKAYGAKVVSWVDLPNDPALNSRCITVSLQETKRTDLKRMTDPEIRKVADRLQKQLLYYRFDKLNSLALPRVDGADRLHGRNRDLYEALALANGDLGICEELVRTFEILQETNCEPLSPHQTVVLRTLFLLVHTVECRHFGRWVVGDVAGYVNWWLKSRRERFELLPREVGSILTTLGIGNNRKRGRWGYRVCLDRAEQKRIHELVFRYGLDGSLDDPNPSESSSEYRLLVGTASYETCEFCQALKHPKEVRPKAEPASESHG